MKSYLITDPNFYTNNPQTFQNNLQNVFQKHTIDMACFRDKISSNYDELAQIFIDTCKNNNITEYYLNGNIELSLQYKATGVHLTSTQFDTITHAKNLGLKVIISCHNEDEIQCAIESGADKITYSPIFTTPNKGEPKGINNLKTICETYPQIPIIALGGIVSQKHINLLKNTNCYGFASIRFFC